MGNTAAKVLCDNNLARDFGAKARYGVGTFYEAVVAAEPPSLGRWKTLFGNASGHDPRRRLAGIEKLAQSYGTRADGVEPDTMLFALHTYYSLLVKLLAGQVVAHCHRLPTPIEKLGRADTSQRRQRAAEEIAAGNARRELHVENLFRDDPFCCTRVRGPRRSNG